MALSPKLDLRQTQSLVMTPQLMQSIRLLQLTHVELESFIDQEIEKNPLLERAQADEPFGGEVEPDGRDAMDLAEPQDGSEEWLPESPDLSAMADTFDSSLENVFPDEPGTRDFIGDSLASQWKSSAGDGYVSTGDENFNLELVTPAAITLRDHVTEQVAFAFRDTSERLLAHELAEHLDESGYFRGDLAEIGERLGAGRADIERVLSTLQGFDPAGLFARDLAECLVLQMRARGRSTPAMEILLANLELLAKRDFHSLKRLCRVSEAEILAMLREVQGLDPKPGAAFASDVADSIVPDIHVRRDSAGAWQIELNPEALPRVLVNNSYYAQVMQGKVSPGDKSFLGECLQNANWLTRSLDQRAQTILKVAGEIVRRQEQFLLHGVTQLKPLNLRAVADAIGMHESTVSRVTANKYMLTERGVFELRYFFTAAIAANDGQDNHSSQSVRHQIKQLIDAETADAVLSDDTIVDILKAQNIDIARRTVAKYRESMNIASSVQRRREKKAQAGTRGANLGSGFITRSSVGLEPVGK
ncbi:RNA polymerase factor sigma-54 [Phyllobacterium sp. 0TCS1.6C]|uniref:RNA polymerase factor sigma-54 n=1 Tax=unclassified Phyllobacterium TaxID=2638441 RepID=UPI0022646999|nr:MULTISPECIES: RNA polymerase factor sigma-54 [unclassified Phyllobacterium]MCX8278587.1 RNA polymerase factor sigma-54 [Phyllobacterium sp. 0TCS1.6C]MCX8293583.1 RNA polymerase factor sigma-54 [Phyllobacterium sp. 0TCS1.6A]